MADISDLPSPPSGEADISDLPVPEDTGSKYSVKDILKRATALPEAVIKGIGKVTGQEISMAPQEPVKMGAGERATQAGISTGVGGAIGLMAPKILKAIPYAPAKIAGQAMELIPPAQRAIGGMAGGAATDVATQAAESYGAPTAVKMPLQMMSATLGDMVGQKLTQSLISLTKAGAYGLKGNIPLAASYLGGALGESQGQREFQAATRQKQIFGQPQPGFELGAETSKFRNQTTQDLNKFVEEKYNVKVPVGETASTVLRNKMYDDVASVVEQDVARQNVVKEQVDALKKRLMVTKINEQGPIKAQIAELESAVPSSLFSKSQEFQQFEKQLNVLKERGSISNTDYKDLLSRLKTDTNKNPDVRRSYGKTVDEIVREWQGSLTAEGKAALPASISKDVRSKLRDSFANWQEKAGIGSSEKDYRAAFRAEKTAEAKDKIPYIISKLGVQGDADKLALQTLNDPYLKGALRDSMRKHLQNTPTEKIASEFERMSTTLQRAGLLNSKDATRYRSLVNQIEKLRKEGKSSIPMATRLQRQLIRSMAITAGEQAVDTTSQAIQGK